jgi:2-polyprenyl-3-methyl-5-hydroxy-6-metoxy-1,4-benzoquinol methylase
MRRPTPDPAWPDSWRDSYGYDRLELFGETHHPGYSYAYATRRRHTLELIARAAPPPASILDVAAAQGNFSLTLAEAGYRVTWNDIRAELEGFVRLKHEHGDVRYAPGDIFSTDLPGLFDIVLMTEVIEHVAHPDLFLARARSLVVPGGHVVLTTPNGGYFRNRLPRFSDCLDTAAFEAVQFKPNADGHIFLLHEDEIEALSRRSGLRVREIRLFALPLTCGHLGTGRLLRWLPSAAVERAERLADRLTGSLKRRACVQMAAWLQRTDAP